MGKLFSACEIVEMGIRIEENGYDFYSTLSAKAKDPNAAQVFKYLAGEEKKHIDAFKKLFSKSCKYDPKGAYTEEYFAFMRALAGQYVFTVEGKGKALAESAKCFEDALNMSIRFEKDSILFFQEMKSLIPEADRKTIDALIAEEKRHLVRLCDAKGGNQGEECKGV